MIGLVMTVIRGLDLAAMMSLLGTTGVIGWVLPADPGDRVRVEDRLLRLCRISGGVAVLTGLAWFVLQTASISGAVNLTQTAMAMPVVAEHTRYGGVMMVRLALLVMATLLVGRSQLRLYPALLLAAAALGLQGLIGHAGAMGGGAGAGMLASEALHLLAAGLWLGAILPLWLCVGWLPLQTAASVCERFSPIGLACVLVIAGTGLAQAIVLIGGLPALFGTTYGQLALLKIGLFLAALVLAALNRIRLTDRLTQGHPNARRTLRLSLSCETLIGLAIILAAAFLASNMPATHETPVWPFPWRLSLAALADPQDRWHLLVILLPSGIAAVAMIAGWFRRWLFWLALAGLIISLVVAGPKLAALLTIEAYPTTFATSPTEFADSSIVHGASLFAARCATCHGPEGKGNGPAADLTAAHFRAHTEGDLFWYISHGMTTPSGVMAMPAFAGILSTDERWALIDFLKAHNAAFDISATGRWNTPVPLPQFDARCADGSTIERDDLLGKVIHIVTDADHAPRLLPALSDMGIITILVASDHEASPAGGICVTLEPTAPAAFAILSNVSPRALAGTQMLADRNGWLRLRWRPGDPGDWNDPAVLAEVVRDIAAHPFTGAAGGAHAHHQ